MKKLTKGLLCGLLAALLCATVLACAKEEAPETEPVLMVPATYPTEGEASTEPIYTRPSDQDEEEDFQEEEEGESGGQTGESTENEEGEEGEASSGASTDTDSGEGIAGVTSASNVKGTMLTQSALNSFPIKSSSMSVAQMRQLCVDFLRFAKTALWSPVQSMDFIRNAKMTPDSMTGGQLYGGLPYVGSASGNVYRLMDYIDANGRVDLSQVLPSLEGVLSAADLKYFGNQCANGAYQGWGRVINSVKKHPTTTMTKYNGYIPLGPYVYDTEKIRNWKDAPGYHTSDVTKANGQQVMFQSYALLQPADGLVYYTTAGHVIMCSSAAHVEYIPGSDLIDGNKSYITMIDQATKWETYSHNGESFQIKSNVDAKVTFSQLFSGNYVPFTFGEFLGTDPVEATTASFSHTGDTATLGQLFSAKATANYGITDAYVIVTDASGAQVYKHAVRNTSAYAEKLSMAATGANVNTWGAQPTTGGYTVQVVLQLCTGERPTVYTGALVAE